MAELPRDRRNLASEQAQVSLGRGWAARLKQHMHFKYVFHTKKLVSSKNVQFNWYQSTTGSYSFSLSEY